MHKLKILTLILISFLLYLTLSCREEKTYKIETINGVKHIYNQAPLWGSKSKIKLEFVQKFGGTEETDKNYKLNKPSDIAVDKHGNIYILDSFNYRIQKYDKSGKYILTIGKKGQSQGEFRHYLRNIDIQEDIIYVTHTNLKLDTFSIDGKYLGRLNDKFFVTFLRHFSSGEFLSKSGVNLDTHQGKYKFDYPGSYLVKVLSKTDGSVIRRFGKPDYYENGMECYSANQVYTDADKNDDVYVCFEYRNRIDKYSYDGERLFTGDYPLKFEVTEKPEWVETNRKINPLPSYNIVCRGMGIDVKNRIWILSPNRVLPSLNLDKQKIDNSSSVYDLKIFNSDGILLCTMPLPVKWIEPRIRIFGDRLFLIETENEMCVFEYKIVDK